MPVVQGKEQRMSPLAKKIGGDLGIANQSTHPR